ncbi:MAG: hypothetical protein KGI33_01190 [Thaumarchaeota archaeon]|nr:hypothetical protein [Nitrososphaerota archaeon]
MTTNQEQLDLRFKIKAAISIGGVILLLVYWLYYISLLPCPSSVYSFLLKTQECDISNILGVSMSLIVAGIFAIILSWIFYNKQKIQSNRIEGLAGKELELTRQLSLVNRRLTELEFEQRRIDGCRILIRNLRELSRIVQIIEPVDGRGPFRSIRNLDKRDEIVGNIRHVIDTIPFSRNPDFPLVQAIEDLCVFALTVPDRNTSTPTDLVFTVREDPNYELLTARVNQMIQTLIGFQQRILERTTNIEN